MTNRLTLNPQWFEAYWHPFRRHVHELLAWGYQDARCKFTQDHEEEEITGFIAEAIQERLESPICPRWCEHYALKENNPVAGKNLTGKHRKVPDFIFELTKYPRPEYIFEAKRLRSHRNFREKYYLEKGLKRFLQEEYASKYLEAGMIGYVQHDTVDDWIARLKRLLHEDLGKEDGPLTVKSLTHDELIVRTIPKEWLSSHMRASGHEITIYHIMFDCCSPEASNQQQNESN